MNKDFCRSKIESDKTEIPETQEINPPIPNRPRLFRYLPLFKSLRFCTALILPFYLSACAPATEETTNGNGTTYSVDGTVTGLAGTVVLQNNGGDDLTITADESFTFETALADGSAYAVTVSTQPFGQTCTISNGSGTISSANVSNVSVSCVSSVAGSTFPIATTSTSEFAVGAAFDGTNWLVGIQGDNLHSSSSDETAQIAAQLIGSSGSKVGSLIGVNGNGGVPQVAFDGTNYLLVWEDDANSPDNDIYGQFIDTSGVKVGSPFAISQAAGKQHLESNSVVFDGTNYLVVWDDSRVAEFDKYVYGQFVSTSGTLVESEIKISANQGQMSSVVFDGTNHLVVWDTGTAIRGQLSNAGSFVDSEFTINTKQQSVQDYNPVGIAFDGTNYLIVWHDRVGDGGVAWDLFGQLMDASGNLVGGVISVTTEPGTQIFPSVAFDGTNFLVTWNDANNDANGNWTCDSGEGTCWDVYGLYISTAGSLVGSSFAINTYAGNQLTFMAGYGGDKYLVLINNGFAADSEGIITVDDVYGQFITP